MVGGYFLLHALITIHTILLVSSYHAISRFKLLIMIVIMIRRKNFGN